MWCKIESSFPSSWHLLTDSIHIHLWFRELILKDENETFWSSPKFQSTSLNSFFYMTAGCIAFNLSWRCSKCCGNVHFHPPKENRGDSFSRQGNNYLGYESRSVLTTSEWQRFFGENFISLTVWQHIILDFTSYQLLEQFCTFLKSQSLHENLESKASRSCQN